MSDKRIPLVTAEPRIDVGAAMAAASSGVVAPSSGRLNLFDLDRAGMERFFEEELGEKKFRAHQLMKWMYHRHETDFGEMTDVGKALRA